MGAGPLQMVAWFTPLGLGGVILAVFGGFFLHMVHANVLMFICTLAAIIASLLFALQPKDGGYWPWVFPGKSCEDASSHDVASQIKFFRNVTC